MTQSESVEHPKGERRLSDLNTNVNDIDVFSCNEFEDKDFKIIKRKEKMSAPSTSFCSQKHVPDGQTDCLSSPGDSEVIYLHKFQYKT